MYSAPVAAGVSTSSWNVATSSPPASCAAWVPLVASRSSGRTSAARQHEGGVQHESGVEAVGRSGLSGLQDVKGAAHSQTKRQLLQLPCSSLARRWHQQHEGSRASPDCRSPAR